MAWRITRCSTVIAIGLAIVFALGIGVIPGIFTNDAEVIGQTRVAWWFFVAVIPVAGVVFALDGVLLVAGDAAYLRNATLASAVVGFLPLIWM